MLSECLSGGRLMDMDTADQILQRFDLLTVLVKRMEEAIDTGDRERVKALHTAFGEVLAELQDIKDALSSRPQPR
jgi:hypothetical protein